MCGWVRSGGYALGVYITNHSVYCSVVVVVLLAVAVNLHVSLCTNNFGVGSLDFEIIFVCNFLWFLLRGWEHVPSRMFGKMM